MIKTLLAAVAVAGGALAMALPASAMTVDLGAGVTKSAATQVAWYCNANGRHCVQGPRPGYRVRNGWAPNCAAGWGWDGYRCARGVVIAPAPVVVAPPVVVRPGPVVVAPGVKVRPNGTVVIRP